MRRDELIFFVAFFLFGLPVGFFVGLALALMGAPAAFAQLALVLVALVAPGVALDRARRLRLWPG